MIDKTSQYGTFLPQFKTQFSTNFLYFFFLIFLPDKKAHKIKLPSLLRCDAWQLKASEVSTMQVVDHHKTEMVMYIIVEEHLDLHQLIVGLTETKIN